ncbi:MAG TPA: PH domain-containing protein [Saprospiraceae bacterium]|nr:PH domain-containing protein [Saprospiraceae bacterium]
MVNTTNFQILTDELTLISDLKFEKVSPAAFKSTLIVRILLLTTLVAAAFALWFIVENDYFIVLLALGFLSLVIFISILYSRYYYKLLMYAIREKDITVKDGVIFLNTTTLPFNRVQHVEINQSFVQRYFKIATLQLYTAGGSGVDLTLPGLSEEIAEKIKSFIINKNAKVADHNGEEE